MLLAYTALSAMTTSLRAEDLDESKAYKVKAAYLYNFAKFTRWPDRAFKNDNSPFVIGVLDNEHFADVVRNTVRNKTIHNRNIVVLYINWSHLDGREKVMRCHMVYLCKDYPKHLKKILAFLNKSPLLSVSDSPDFAVVGGMIEFVLEEGRFVFDINRKTIEQASMKISSKLLNLARFVWDVDG